MARDEWDPFQELLQLRRRFSELFERSLVEGMHEETGSPGYWNPSADVFQDDDGIHVQVELPGIVKEEVDIQFKGSSLIIRGVRNSRQVEGTPFFHRLERQQGPFERIIELNHSIDVDGITAHYELGILTIKLPIRQGPVQRRIELSEEG